MKLTSDKLKRSEKQIASCPFTALDYRAGRSGCSVSPSTCAVRGQLAGRSCAETDLNAERSIAPTS